MTALVQPRTCARCGRPIDDYANAVAMADGMTWYHVVCPAPDEQVAALRRQLRDAIVEHEIRLTLALAEGFASIGDGNADAIEALFRGLDVDAARVARRDAALRRAAELGTVT